jgi:RHS repeat-associated protein
MTGDQTGNTLVFDAWNGLVAYKSGSTLLESYSYDALNRRIIENPGTQRVIYYSSSWQVLEEDVSGLAQVQYVWSPAYVDAMIERDRGTERLYVQQDANWNVTAVISTSGAVQERYVYDPYGAPTFLTPNWSNETSSVVAWNYLHHGGRYDGLSGLYLFRNREYSAILGRWISQDPIGFSAGDPNLYRYVTNNTFLYSDPFGLEGDKWWHHPGYFVPGPWENGWSDVWYVIYPPRTNLGSPAHRNFNPDQTDRPGLKAGDIIDRDSRDWANQANQPLKSTLGQAAMAITPQMLGMKARPFICKYCQGSINTEFPSQFYCKTLAEIKAAAQAGDADARKAWKLLNRGKYRK